MFFGFQILVYAIYMHTSTYIIYIIIYIYYFPIFMVYILPEGKSQTHFALSGRLRWNAGRGEGQIKGSANALWMVS